MSGKEGLYDVLWPRGRKAVPITQLARRLPDLKGKTVAQLWDYLFRGDEIFPMLEQELGQRFAGLKFVNYEAFGSTHGDEEHQVLAELPAKLKRLGVDAVISGMAC
jgi:hypothetical protein